MINITDIGNGWREGVYNGHFFQAKVYDLPSSFGINEGRVSKLGICSTSYFDHNHTVYNYDRGLDFNECPPGVLQAILEACEALPKTLPKGYTK